jgi:hypothetical protein
MHLKEESAGANQGDQQTRAGTSAVLIRPSRTKFNSATHPRKRAAGDGDVYGTERQGRAGSD